MLNRPTFTVSRLYAIVLTVVLVAAVSVIVVPIATAQTSLSQCNGTDNVGGQAVECHYTVTNNLNGSETSSSTTITECHGAANDPATLVCTPSTSTSTQLVTVVDQCNGSGNGGGGTVRCTVNVTNNVTGSAATRSSTVNQCNASGLGGGTAPTVLCDPFPASTTSADVTQCNESGNGGGGTLRVRCSVDSDSTSTSLLAITVNQCNGSGNGGGATVTCQTGMTTNLLQVQPSPTPSATAPVPSVTPPVPSVTPPVPSSTPPVPVPTVPVGSVGGPDNGSGSAGNPDEGVTRRSDSATTGQVVRVPLGGVGAGGGSTSGFENFELLIVGLLFIAAGALRLIPRRRPAKV